jgi:hypothetical protein
MKAFERAMRLINRKPRAVGGGTDDDSDAVPYLMQDAIATAPQDTPPPQPQAFHYRGASIPLQQPEGANPLTYKAPMTEAQGQAPAQTINYIQDEVGNIHQVPAGTPGARTAPEGTSLGPDGQFYNERSPIGLVGKTMGALGYDTPGHARESTSWGTAAGNTLASLSPGYLTESAQRTVQLPEEVREGKVAPNDVMRNLEFVANVGMAGAQFAEPGSAGIFGGRLAQTADHAKLAQAEKMADMGAHPEDIYRMTGWFQGPVDGKWRFEINDKNSKVNPAMLSEDQPMVGHLGDVLDHPELYAAYPQLSESALLSGDLSALLGKHGYGGFTPNKGFTVINTPAFEHPEAIAEGANHRRTLLHEGDHAAAAIEGFENGTSAQTAPTADAESVARERYQNLQIAQSQARQAYRANPTPENRQAMQAAIDAVSQVNPFNPSPLDYYDAYRRSAGEVSARNVEKRADMSAGQRQFTPPWETQDIPPNRQFAGQSYPPLQKMAQPEDVAQEWENALNPALYANADDKSTQALGAAARSREIDPMGFYSPSLEAAKAIPQQTGTVSQMRSMLLNAGAKPKELAATGFDQAFPDPNAKVSRQQIEDYLRQNRVQLGETAYQKPQASAIEGFKGEMEQKYGDGWIYKMSPEDDARWQQVSQVPETNLPKFESYSTPGGIPGSYSERLLTLPTGAEDALKAFQDHRAQLESKYGQAFARGASREELDEHNRLAAAFQAAKDNKYTSSHWPDVENPVLHYRSKDFPGAEGGKTRLLDEMQSDWAQRARDQGIKGDINQIKADYQDALNERDAARQAYLDYGESLRGDPRYTRPLSDAEIPPQSWQLAHRALTAGDPKATALKQEFERASEVYSDRMNKLNAAHKGVPNAPFIGNTSDWTDLGIKKSLIDAARDPDVNRMAWTPGSVQNQRYGLEHHVDSIDVLPVDPSLPNNPGVATVRMKNGQRMQIGFSADGLVNHPNDFVGKNLSEVFGNEVAQKILSKTTPTSIRGMDLSIGGEGQKGYYDKIVPNRIQEVMKKQGLGKPEFENWNGYPEQTVKYENRGKPRSEYDPGYPSFQMTPEMRQKILNGGLSLFNKQDPYAAAILNAISREGEGVGREQVGNKAAEGLGTNAAGASGRGELPGGAGGMAAQGRAADPYARIPGIPETAKIPGHGEVAANPIPWVVDAANDYAKKAGINHNLPEAFGPLDEARAKRIAQAFEDMEHDPTNPEVRRAYEAMADETLAQYRALKGQGARYTFNNGTDPYAKSPAMGYPELRDQRSLSIFPTDEGFGTGAEAAKALENNPLLKKTGEKFGDREATVNDLFRAVHDSFGHFGFGNPFFRAPGEERAWMLHSGMYGPEARKAMTSETRGQNSWLNSGPHAEHNKTASGADTVFAPQKTGLMPDWVTNEGANGITKQQYDSIQRAMRTGRNKLFSNADDTAALPLGEIAREGLENKQPTPAPKPEKPIVPREDLEDGFYSHQVDALKNQIQMKSGNVQQWRNALKKAGVKDEEMKWTGMTDYLNQLEKSGQKQISRDDLLKHAQDNKVIPKTERYTGNGDHEDDDAVWERAYEYGRDSAWEDANDRYSIKPDPDWIEKYRDEHEIQPEVDEDGDPTGTFKIVHPDDEEYPVATGIHSEEAAEHQLDNYAKEQAEELGQYAVVDHNGDVISSHNSKRRAERGLEEAIQSDVEDWNPQDEGGIDHWREVLDMPAGSRTEHYLDERPEGYKEGSYTERVMETPQQALKHNGTGRGHGAHIDWPQQNIPGWLLTEEYHNALDNGRVGMVHEAQSDWAQKGIDKGFASSNPEEIAAAQKDYEAASEASEAANDQRPYQIPSHIANLNLPELSDAADARYERGDHESALRDATDSIADAARTLRGNERDMGYYERSINDTKQRLSTANDERDKDYFQNLLDHHKEVYARNENELDKSRKTLELTVQKYKDLLAAAKQVPPEEASAREKIVNDAELRRREAESKYHGLRDGTPRGPWINDVPEVTKLLLKRGLIDAAKEGQDYFAWSSPELVANRWGERGYTTPLYGKMIPDIAKKLAREHDPNASIEPVFPGEEMKPRRYGNYDVWPESNTAQQSLSLDNYNPDLYSTKGGVSGTGSNVNPVKEIAYGPARPGYSGDPGAVGGMYHLIYKDGSQGPEFATREAAERAMEQVNSQIGTKAPPTIEQLRKDEAPEIQGIKITPRMRESILKRGFSAFFKQDPTVAAALSAASGQQNNDIPDYVEPAAKRRLKKQ